MAAASTDQIYSQKNKKMPSGDQEVFSWKGISGTIYNFWLLLAISFSEEGN